MITFLLSTALAGPAVFRFESGLRVVVDHQPEGRWVSTAMVFDSGEADVPVGQEHLAHLLEHLWYRGGEPISRGEAFRALGCDTQAFTWPRSVEFLATCPADVLDPHLDLLATHFDGALAGVDEADIAIERDVVTLEVGAYRESPITAVVRAIASQMDPDQGLRARLAREGVGAGLDVAAIAAHAGRTWTPERAVLAIVSPVPPADLRLPLQERFGPILSLAEAGPPPPAPAERRRTLRVDVRTVTAPVDIPLVTVSWELPYGLLAEATSLTSWLELALSRRLVGEGGAAPVSCAANLAASTPVVSCALGVRPEADPVVAARLLRHLADVREDVSRSLVAEAAAESLDSRLVAAITGSDALAPAPFNWPALRAYGMLRANRVLPNVALPGGLKRRQVKALTAAAVEAFDPQRALVMAVVPEPGAAALPAARPAPDRLVPAPPPAPPLVSEVAPIRQVPGGIAVQRSDFRLARRLSFEEGRLSSRAIGVVARLSADPDRQQVVVGPEWPLGVDAGGEPWLAEAWSDAESLPQPDGLVAIAARCPGDGHLDATLLVTKELLERRVWHGLREGSAWTYTPLVWLDPEGLHVHADVLSDAVDPARAVLAATFAELAAGVTDAELAVARRRASIRGSTALALPPHWPELFAGKDGVRTAAALEALPGAVAGVRAAAVAQVVAGCLIGAAD